jgi:hypothetical protein
MNFLDIDISRYNATLCFGDLWTPCGRGSIYSTQLIDWLDTNAWFKIGPWTLREWSQLSKPPPPSKTKDTPSTRREAKSSTFAQITQFVATRVSFTSTPSALGRTGVTSRMAENPQTRLKPEWEIINNVLSKVLGSGMRLAEIETKDENTIPGEFGAALVHPYARVSDDVFFLRGCSYPVTLRRNGASLRRYEVVAGAWLDASTPRLKRYSEWANGNDNALHVHRDDIRVLKLS